ncbi:MAG: replication-relaxation family protein [Cyanobacteriota bacterium]
MESVKKKSRYKYFLPPVEERGGIYLHRPVYKKILWYLWKFKYCTVDHITALLSANLYKEKNMEGEIEQVPTTSIQHNLLSLWENEYIVKRVTNSKSKTRAGSDKDIWQLAEKGASFLAESEGIFIEQVHYPKLPNTSKPHSGEPTGEYDFLKHNLLITDTIVAFHVFCALSKKHEIVYFEPDTTRKYSFAVPEGNFFIRPDGLIILEGNDKNGKKARLNFFLEIDRSTETLGDFQKKLISYFHLKKNEKQISFFEEIYQEETIPVLEEVPESSFKHMRVLTLTTSPKRVLNMVKSTYPIFNDKTGSMLFCFTSIEKFLPLSERVEVLNKEGSKKYKKIKILFENVSKVGSDIWNIGSIKVTKPSSIL